MTPSSASIPRGSEAKLEAASAEEIHAVRGFANAQGAGDAGMARVSSRMILVIADAAGFAASAVLTLRTFRVGCARTDPGDEDPIDP